MVKSIAKWMGNILLALLAMLFISSMLMTFQSYKNPGEIPSFFGYKVMTVLSGSMRPEIQPGDIVIDKVANVDDLEKGDIFTYKREDKYITHRIIEVIEEDSAKFFKAKGDANNTEDSLLITSDAIEGTYVTHIPKAGFFLEFARGPIGMLLFVVVPAIILVISELFKKKKKKNTRSDRPYPKEDVV